MACSSLSAPLLLMMMMMTVVIGTARGGGGGSGRGGDKDALTAGFRRVRLTESQFVVQKPYDVPLRDRYEFVDGVRRMWVFSTDKPISRNHPGGARTEIKINEVYRSGVWQFTGEIYVPTGTSGVSIMQIFGAKPERQATTLMLHVYDGRLTFYHDLQRVLADDIYDRWVRLNVVHDISARNVTVFVDGAERLRSLSHGSQDAPHYFKFGVYKQSHNHPSHRMESRWRNVQVFTKP